MLNQLWTYLRGEFVHLRNCLYSERLRLLHQVLFVEVERAFVQHLVDCSVRCE